MSVSENMPFLSEASEFDFGKAEFIAREVAIGGSVSKLHEEYPEMVPNPVIVNRWRRQVPAFNVVMEEAEQAKAQRLADEVVTVSDDDELLAAQASNKIKARQWLSGQLSESFRNGKKSEGGTSITVNGDLRLTDAQLMEIASGKFIEGQSERVVEEAPALVESVVVEAAVEPEEVAAVDGAGMGEGSEGEPAGLRDGDRAEGVARNDSVAGEADPKDAGDWDFL